MTLRRTVVASGVRYQRADGAVLLVRARQGPGAGRWAIPFAEVPEYEVAEDTATRLLRDVLHLQPGLVSFADTLVLPDADGDTVINVFDAIGWSGEPRYSPNDVDDAGWVQPSAIDGLDVPRALAEWLASPVPAASAPVAEPSISDRGALAVRLVDARRELLAAFEAIPAEQRERPLDGEWAPVDVMHHAAVVEGYYLDESFRLVERPGHVWRPWNEDQAEADRRARARPNEAEVRARLDAQQGETLRRLHWLQPDQLAYRGSHPTRGLVRVDDCIDDIGRHDRAHAEQLRKMLEAAQRA